jgi:hypothetical protein
VTSLGYYITHLGPDVHIARHAVPEIVRIGCNVTIDIVPVQSPEHEAALEALVRSGHYRPGSLGVRQIRGHNLYTNVGLAVLAAGLAGTSSAITHFGLGSSSTVAAATDVALGTEVSKPLITAVTSSGAVATAYYYLGSGMLNGSTLREAGVWVGLSLIARYVYNDADFQPKTSAVAGVFSWTFTFARL